MGRVTYEQMAAHWPTATGDYAAFMNELPKVVFSRTLPGGTVIHVYQRVRATG